MRTRSLLATAVLGLSLAAQDLAATPTAVEVGDPDSFGRNAKYLGLISGGFVLLLPSCVGEELGPNDRCFVLSPGDALTAFDAKDLGRVMLPARSTETLIYPLISPNLHFQFQNSTGTPQPNARFTFVPYFTLESDALNDPTLINPNTGQSFNGKLDLDFAGKLSDRSLAVGERIRETLNYSRVGIGGIATEVLKGNFGLSQRVIDRIFRGPITLRINMRGSARHVSDAILSVSSRLMGD